MILAKILFDQTDPGFRFAIVERTPGWMESCFLIFEIHYMRHSLSIFQCKMNARHCHITDLLSVENVCTTTNSLWERALRVGLNISDRYGCTSGRYTFRHYVPLFTITGTQPSYDFLVVVRSNIWEFRRVSMPKFETTCPHLMSTRKEESVFRFAEKTTLFELPQLVEITVTMHTCTCMFLWIPTSRAFCL